MAVSVFDLFNIGIGPSSSHTVGPMRAARMFADSLAGNNAVGRVQVDLFGSLGATGKGHGTDKAVVLGLQGDDPETVDTDRIPERLHALKRLRRLVLSGGGEIEFDPAKDLVFHRRKSLPFHPNGLRFRGFDRTGSLFAERTYYSVGGGFVVDEAAAGEDRIVPDTTVL